MTAGLLAGIAVASAAGSLHCIAMCGPLVGLHGGSHTLRLALVHSLGRLVTYTAVGAIAGLVGSAIDIAGRLGNIQRAATIVSGAVIVAWGLWSIAALRSVSPPTPRVAKAKRPSAFSRGLVQIRTRPPAMRAWLTGILTGLLPCGWWWAFAVAAAGTGSAPSGAMVMAAFWLGTVPAMVGLLRLTGPIVARLRTRAPVVTAIALIAVGLGALAARWSDAGTQQVASPTCHSHRQLSW